MSNEPIDLTQYDTLIIATPVWAENLNSPVRSFLASYAIEGKRVFLVANDRGGPFGKCFATMRTLLPKSTIEKEIGFAKVTKKSYPTHQEKLETFCKEIFSVE